ncbi:MULTISPECIES: hypothetical protein [Sphingomonas]|uniref:hypothetical protein n=1 Tax=Sphingomonas TaxID=13687 RepID=UPI00126A0020|nr:MULTISPECIES: hypothetical protein [Sphingomonas]
MFTSLAVTELLVVHLFLALKWPWLAWPLSATSVLGIAWLIGTIRSFRRMPHELTDGELRLHVGRLRSLTVPLGQVAAVRGVIDGAEVKASDTANLGLISYPNRMVDLIAPLRFRRRTVLRIALALDDPAAFDLALQR